MTKLNGNELQAEPNSRKELLQLLSKLLKKFNTVEICRNLDTVPALPALLLQALGEAALPCPQSANQPVQAAGCSITSFPSCLTVCRKKTAQAF